MTETNLRVSFDVACMRSLKKTPTRVFERFHDMLLKVMSDPSRHGLNVEPVEGARDSGIKSIRVDQAYRAIAYQQGKELLFLHVDEHDKAYRWAINKAVRFNPALNRIQVLDIGEPVSRDATASQSAAPSVSAPSVARPKSAPSIGLFDAIADADFERIGVASADLPHIRSIASEEALEASEESFDPATYDALVSLAAGYRIEDIPALITHMPDAGDIVEEIAAYVGREHPMRAAFKMEESESAEASFAHALRTDESRQEIFIPGDEDELKRFLNGDLEGWRVFLHPEQRRLAYRDFSGPVLVRGGAGTGKTVVAMHRAKFLADRIAVNPQRTGEKVLFTTFTATLASDVRNNLRTLCSEHLTAPDPRIEVINLDRWVSEFLRRRGFERRIVYFGDDRQRLDDIWDEVLGEAQIPAGLSNAFIKDEWTQVVLAKGLATAKAYASVSRAGRGTPLDRKKRLELWPVFDTYRARLIDEGLTEPDDAYREAIALLGQAPAPLPYAHVVVDEAQDMGEQALKLIRAIAPPLEGSDKNRLFLVGDAHQRIYGRKATMAGCGIAVTGRSKRLRLNYRTTDLIRRWAVGVLEGVAVDDLDDKVETLDGYRSLVKGVAPSLAGYPSLSQELVALSAWLKGPACANVAPHNIAVLARTNGRLGEIAQQLERDGIAFIVLKNNVPDDLAKEGVRLATMHRAKGLEYHNVAIAGLSDQELPPAFLLSQAVDAASRRELIEREKALVHVAATRARRYLRISWHGKRPGLLVE